MPGLIAMKKDRVRQMMKNKSQLMLAMLFITLGDVTSANAEPKADERILSATAPERTTESAMPQVEAVAIPADQEKAGPSNADLVAALNSYDRTLAQFPQNVPAREGRLLALSQLGLPSEALAEAKMYPQVDQAVLQHLHEDEAALTIRQTESGYYRPGEERADYDKAIALTEDNLRHYPNSARSRFDMVRALNNRKRYADAIVVYESLERDGIAIPGYVDEAAGSAYLAQKKPERSAQVYRAALAANPDAPRANIGLFYALVDQSDYAAARSHIDAYAAKTKTPQDNFEAATAALFERAYETDYDAAQQGFLNLQREAPASDQLHLALGKIYLWRGWPRLAKQEFEIVAQHDQDSLAAQSGLIETAVALGDYQSAGERLSPLLKTTPDDGDVKKMQRAGELRDYNELLVLASGSRSRENLGNGRGVIVETKLLGKPIGYQTRPFIHEYFERGISNDIKADYRRLGLGAEHTIAGVGTVQAELQQEFFRDKRTSVSVGSRLNPTDYTELRLAADSNSLAVPLVARYYGIRGWSAGIGGTWRANERLALSVDYSQMNMSDDNIRREISVQGAGVIIQGPVYKGTIGLEFSAGSNSLENTVYFNPKNAHAAQISYISDWTTYQRYSRSFSNRLILAVGRYTEHGFATGNIGSIGYEGKMDLNDTMSIGFGIGYVRRIYSGVTSSGPEAHLGFNWKFL
jgi:biofilm PGA synthesis protein PgaA